MASSQNERMERRFSPWFRWSDRTQYPGINLPGVYVVAISRPDISGKSFSFRKEIVYVGITNTAKGLKLRLEKFDKTIQSLHKPSEHGGADRFRKKHQNYPSIRRKMFVSFRSFQCPEDEAGKLRVTGEVLKAELDFMALCIDKFGSLPEFNDKKKSIKWSRYLG